MSLLTVCQALATNAGMAVPSQIVGSASREWVEALEMANNAGQELARRVDWGALSAAATLTGDGTNLAHTLPSGFDRLQRGVTAMSGTSILRPLTRAEWNTLVAVEGTPRFFLLENDTITLWPFLATGETVAINYQSENWVNSAVAYTADDQVAVIDEGLIRMGLIVRWRRQKGMPVDDFEAEYEAAIIDRATFDGRVRF